MAPTIAFLNMRVKPFDDVRARRASRWLRARPGGDRQGSVPGARQAAGERAAPGVPDAIDLNEMYPYTPGRGETAAERARVRREEPVTLHYPHLESGRDDGRCRHADQKPDGQRSAWRRRSTWWMQVTRSIGVLVKHDFEMAVIQLWRRCATSTSAR